MLDFKEKKYFSLKLGFSFSSTNTFESLVGAWSDKANVAFWFYGYIYLGCPNEPALDWTQAKLHLPQGVTVCTSSTCATTQPNVNDEPASSNSVIGSPECRHLNFFGGGRAAVAPMPPPAGTYAINVGARAFTFRYVATPDMTEMQNIYVPVIRMTRAPSGGSITLIEWQWWEKRAGVWSQPTQDELSLFLARASLILGRPDWAGDPNADRLTIPMALTVNGAVTPPAQTFTPGVLMVGTGDKAEYDYAFEFR